MAAAADGGLVVPMVLVQCTMVGTTLKDDGHLDFGGGTFDQTTITADAYAAAAVVDASSADCNYA